ncbi:MAG: sn-glycerol-3-phosphate ABC transporter ATP-binding protein UgpC [Dokdonella sp.]
MASVTLDSIRKVYDNGTIGVAGATFEIADGEFLVLVGPSGCGKSTLLRMIAGLETITSGTLKIGDHIVNDVEPKQRDIAMVFQNYALYPHMSVAENLAFGLKLRDTPEAEVKQRVAEAATWLELTPLLSRKPGQLSGGQRQRVALGRALVRKPSVFLLDEPLSNLDAKLRLGMRTEIARLHRRLKTTMVYVTHDQTEAMTLGQRIVVLDAGEIQQIDTPMALYERPINLFVAGFLGSPAMNLLRGTVVDSDAGMHLKCTGMNWPLASQGSPAPESWRAFSGKELIIGIRPEDLRPVAASETGIDTEVELVEPVGNEIFLNLRVGDQHLSARTPPRQLPEVGSTLRVASDPQRLHAFDPTTGLRLPR